MMAVANQERVLLEWRMKKGKEVVGSDGDAAGEEVRFSSGPESVDGLKLGMERVTLLPQKAGEIILSTPSPALSREGLSPTVSETPSSVHSWSPVSPPRKRGGNEGTWVPLQRKAKDNVYYTSSEGPVRWAADEDGISSPVPPPTHRKVSDAVQEVDPLSGGFPVSDVLEGGEKEKKRPRSGSSVSLTTSEVVEMCARESPPEEWEVVEVVVGAKLKLQICDPRCVLCLI
jgi:hypothetical protein